MTYIYFSQLLPRNKEIKGSWGVCGTVGIRVEVSVIFFSQGQVVIDPVWSFHPFGVRIRLLPLFLHHVISPIRMIIYICVFSVAVVQSYVQKSR